MTQPVCDPTTGVCELPPSQEKKEKQVEFESISNLELFKLVNVTTLLNDKGSEIKIDSLAPTPLILLYFSAVLPSA
jgi:hypothetical protein